MPKYQRHRELMDPDTGEVVLSDERILLIPTSDFDRARFVKLFYPAVPILARCKPLEFILGMYALSCLKNGTVSLKMSFEGYSLWCDGLGVPRKDKSSYYRALRGLVELGFVVRGEDGDMEINYDMAFVGNRMKVLKAAESMKRKTDRIVKLEEGKQEEL